MDVAQWAIRRIFAARKVQLNATRETGTTNFSAFTSASTTPEAAYTELAKSNIRFDKGLDKDGKPILDKDGNRLTPAQVLERKLANSCPSGDTPLGIHMMGMIESMKDVQVAFARDESRLPENLHNERKVLTIISDGYDTKGTIFSIEAARKIVREEPNTEIFVIDVGNTPLLSEESVEKGQIVRPDGTVDNTYAMTDEEASRFTYKKAANHDELIDTLYKTIGLCTPPEYAEPVDRRYCGVPRVTGI